MQTDHTTPAVVSPTPAQAAQAGYDEALSFLERFAEHFPNDYGVAAALGYVRGARPGSFAAACIARGEA